MVYSYIIKAVQEYVEDSCVEKMSIEQMLKVINVIKYARLSLNDEHSVRVADYVEKKVKDALAKRPLSGEKGLFIFYANGCVEFTWPVAKTFFYSLPKKEQRVIVTAAMNEAEQKGIVFEKGARGKIRKAIFITGV